MAKYTPTEEEKRRWGITGKRKGGPGRRVHDWDLHRDIVNMPRRDSLPQEGPEQLITPVTSVTGNLGVPPVVDNRSDERKAWDKRMDALRERLEQNRKTEKDQAETYRKRGIQSRVAGRPMDEAGNPVEEPKPAEEPQKESSETATAAQTQGNKLSNGQPKAGQPAAAQPPTRPGALKPKKEPVGPGATRRYGLRAGTGDISWDGTPVPKNFSAARSNLEGILTAETRAARDRAEAAARVQHAVSSHADSEAYQESMNERERIEQMGKDRRARQAAEREAAAQRRADKRYESRTLYNEDDWKNLGREGSNRANYAAEQQAGETTDQYKARQKSIADRDARLAALVKRMDDMGVQDAEKNSFYANDPNKQQNLARLRGLVDKAGKGITDAQMEGVTATLDAWQKGADERGARQKAFTDMKQAEEVSRLRKMYRLRDGEYSPQEVLDFHASQQAAAQRNILKGMQVAPGFTPAQEGEGGGAPRSAAMAKFAQDWQKLIDNGFDPNATFKEAINEGGMREAHKAALATLDRNDPDYADKEDQLRRRFTLQYARQKAGIGEEGGGEKGVAGRQISYMKPDEDVLEGRAFGLTDSPDLVQNMARNLPGKSILAPNRASAEAASDALQPKQPRPQPQPQQTTPNGVPVFNSAADAMQARDAANAAVGLRPRQPQARLRPGDKREETMAW